MKRYFCTILLVSVVYVSYSQTNFNKTWVLGTNYGTNKAYKLRFTQPLQIDTFDNINVLGFAASNSNICDTNGNVIITSDGMNLYDSTGNFIDNGDTLASSDFYNYYEGRNPACQSSIILPFEDKIYYLFTLDATDSMFNWALNNGTLFFDLLLYHKIDMNENGGMGKVIERQKVLFENDTLMKPMMTACRHANGKDWWLVKQMYEYENIYNSKCKIATFLVTKDSVYPPTISYFSVPLISYYDQAGQAMFSQDGTQYAATCRGMNKVLLANFDRCIGIFSNPKTHNVPNYSCHNPNDPSWVDSFTHGLEFSPNGQFLYISKSYNILQLDLTDNDSNSAWYLVSGLDTSWSYFPKYSNLYLGYDEKIYVGYSGAARENMSYINNPDFKGAGSGFCPSCIPFPYYNVSTPPNMPNYDLGELQPCWPLSNNERVKSENYLEVYPNPASTILNIKTESKEKREIYNSVGQLLVVTDKDEINVIRYNRGIYYLKIGRMVKKVIIE